MFRFALEDSFSLIVLYLLPFSESAHNESEDLCKTLDQKMVEARYSVMSV